MKISSVGRALRTTKIDRRKERLSVEAKETRELI